MSHTEVTVRYAETDCMRVVHHSVYPVWFEIARTDFIKEAGMSYADMEKAGIMLPVTGISCRYRLPARYDDTLVITSEVPRLTPARIEFAYSVIKMGEEGIIAEGTSSHGFVDSSTFRPLNLKKVMPELYGMMEKNAGIN